MYAPKENIFSNLMSVIPCTLVKFSFGTVVVFLSWQSIYNRLLTKSWSSRELENHFKFILSKLDKLQPRLDSRIPCIFVNLWRTVVVFLSWQSILQPTFDKKVVEQRARESFQVRVNSGNYVLWGPCSIVKFTSY